MSDIDDATVSPAGYSAGQPDGDTNALLSRLRLIEDQPLDSRAAAFTQVHDQLQSALEGGDSPRAHG